MRKQPAPQRTLRGWKPLQLRAAGVRLAGLALWLVASAVMARAQLALDTATVLTRTGRVSLERNGELWAVELGQSLEPGQVIVTGEDGHAQLVLPDGSTLEIFPNSRVIFRANRFNWRDLLDVYLGRIRLQIQRLTKDTPPLRVTSPTAVISVRGTVFEVTVDPAQETWVWVENGSVGVRHRLIPGREITVEAGQSVRILPTVPLAQAKSMAPVRAIGGVVRMVGDVLAQVNLARGDGSGASGKGSAPAGGGAKPPAGDSGSNEPAPPPGQDDRRNDAPPGDVISPQ